MAKSRYKAPTEEEFEQIIDARPVGLPNCRRLKRTVIKAGPKNYKCATVLEFTKPDDAETVSSRSLTLNTFPFTVFGGLNFSRESCIGHWHCDGREIDKLRAFLEAIDDVQTDGRHTVVPQSHADAFRSFVDNLGNADLSTPQLLELIQALAERAADIRTLPQLGEGNKLRMVAAAIRVAHRQEALAKLQSLIDDEATEPKFQELLDQNWWMFGGHYVEQIPRRNWTTDETLDILLRTADGYFELVELKRSNPQLFKMDHGKWVVTADVSDAINQAAHYISEIERTYSALFQRYSIDLYRLKAKVLIGYLPPDEADLERKRASLRMLNSHLHRIEVVTFDELVRISQNVIDANAGESGQDSVGTQQDVVF